MCNAKNAGCKRGIYCKFANICPLLNQEVAKKNLKEMIRVREDETTNLRNMTSAGYFYYPGLKEFTLDYENSEDERAEFLKRVEGGCPYS